MSDIYSTLQDENESDHWISVADMMAGLMVIFLFIAISYILFKDKEVGIIPSETRVEALQKDKTQLEGQLQEALEEVEFFKSLDTQDLEQYHQQKLEEWKEQLAELIRAQEIEQAIFMALEEEFKDDLPKWPAELSQDLTIRFTSPKILFSTGSDTLKPYFQEVLSDFIPRYLEVLSRQPFKVSIEEIRIEGHTSSRWGDAQNEIDAYFKNMALSQSRTRAVLEYSLDQTGAWDKHGWARSLLTANGLSSSKPIEQDGVEYPELSRRVDFKIRIKVKREILKILEGL